MLLCLIGYAQLIHVDYGGCGGFVKHLITKKGLISFELTNLFFIDA